MQKNQNNPTNSFTAWVSVLPRPMLANRGISSCLGCTTPLEMLANRGISSCLGCTTPLEMLPVANRGISSCLGTTPLEMLATQHPDSYY